MGKISNFLMSDNSFISKECDIEQIQQNINDFRSDRILRITQAFPNFASAIREEEKLIILIDIVGFSKDSTRNQVYKIYLFQRYLVAHIMNNKLSFGAKIRINHFVPTGDGCYIIAEKCDVSHAVDFLISLIKGLKNVQMEQTGNMALRASALIGKVVPFIDMAKHINYIGEGMNEASRILSGGQKALEDISPEPDVKGFSCNSLYLGDSLAKNIEEYKDSCSKIYYFPEVADKHGMKRNITVLQGIG